MRLNVEWSSHVLSEGTHGLRRVFHIFFFILYQAYTPTLEVHTVLCACVSVRVRVLAWHTLRFVLFSRGSALVLRACDGMRVYIVRCERIFRWPGAQQVHFIAWDSRNGAALLASPWSVWARWRRESASSMQATFCCLLCDARLLKAGLDIWIKAGLDSNQNDSSDRGTGTLPM